MRFFLILTIYNLNIDSSRIKWILIILWHVVYSECASCIHKLALASLVCNYFCSEKQLELLWGKATVSRVVKFYYSEYSDFFEFCAMKYFHVTSKSGVIININTYNIIVQYQKIKTMNFTKH